MKASVLATLTVLLASSFAGCLYNSQPTPPADASPDAPPAAPPGGPPPAVDAPGVRAVDVRANVTSPGTGGSYDTMDCDPKFAGLCEMYAHEVLFSRGTFNGTFLDSFHYHSMPDGSVVGGGHQEFVGTIEGCGAGRLSFVYVLAGTVTPHADPDGFVLHGTDDLTLVPGSTTQGLSGIVDARVLETYDVNPTNSATRGPITGTVWCREPPAAPTHDGAREVPVVGKFTSDGSQSHSASDCDETAPGHCRYYSYLFLDGTGTFTGRIQDIFFIGTLPGTMPPNTITGGGVRLFTGTFGECGSGTLAMTLSGQAPVDPNTVTPGTEHFREPTMSLVNGSQSTGLMGVVDGTITLDFNISRSATIDDGTVTGTMWCRPPPTPLPRERATEIPVESSVTSSGTTSTDTQRCEPTRPGVCEIYETQLVQLKGTMTGEILDMAHLRSNLDGTFTGESWRTFTGTIAGCGSGVLALHLKGSFTVPPSTAKPGYIHLREPTMALIAGSGTSGFSGVVDANVTLEGDFFGGAAAHEGDGGKATGSVWCAGDAPAPAAPSAPGGSGAGPTALPIPGAPSLVASVARGAAPAL